MKYEERIKKLNSLNEFINGEYQDDILLILDKKFKEEKWNIICAAMHWFRTVESYLNCEHLLDEESEDYNWGKVYLFLSSVDIVIEGINDINKIAKNNDKTRLFYGDNEIFKDEEKDDWEYFKNIRAIFGAHPTKLKDNKEYIVSTYPTPYNPKINILTGATTGWDYYTSLWSKEKSKDFNQLSFGFKFKDIERYLDKCINYLEVIYKDILNMIYEYKKETAKKEIKKVENPIEQLNILLAEDKDRLNEKYKYEVEEVKVLIETPIIDPSNEIAYQKYRDLLIDKIPYLYKAIQHPEEVDNIEKIKDIINCDIEHFTSMSSYYYTKLFEYWNNEDMEDLLIDHFKDNIIPFNSNISNIKELFCLVKAYNYYKSLSR